MKHATVVFLALLLFSGFVATALAEGRSHENPAAEKALEEMRAKAEQGDAEAQAMLGKYYYRKGRGIPQDNEEAAIWLRKSSQFLTYDHYLIHDDGRSVPPKYADAQAVKGQPGYLDRNITQDYAESVNWCRKAAEQGNAAAQVLLGAMYGDGTGVPQNYGEAVMWFQKAAKQGNAEGQALLGRAYYLGEGVEQDYTEAVNWCRRAAEQGNAGAQALLGRAYYDGNGVLQDYAEAYAWVSIAAAHEQLFASFRDSVTRDLSPEDLSKGQLRSEEVFEKYGTKR